MERKTVSLSCVVAGGPVKSEAARAASQAVTSSERKMVSALLFVAALALAGSADASERR